MEFLKKFQQNYKSDIDIFHDYADNFVAIKDIIYSKLGINLHDYNHDISIRKTKEGYKNLTKLSSLVVSEKADFGIASSFSIFTSCFLSTIT